MSDKCTPTTAAAACAEKSAANRVENPAATVRAFAFTGPSNSGKTTLISKIVRELQSRGLLVAVIKHDPGDKAVFDSPAKDSGKFFAAGAHVAVLSPTRTSVFWQEPLPIEALIACMRADIVLVEGLKTLPLPRLCVFCKEPAPELAAQYLPRAQGVASYSQQEFGLASFWLDDVEKIADFVLENAKIMEKK